MRFCPFCGQENTDDARFCLQCGREMPGATPQPKPESFEQPQTNRMESPEPNAAFEAANRQPFYNQQPYNQPPYQSQPYGGGQPFQPGAPAGYTPPEPPSMPYMPPMPPNQPYYDSDIDDSGRFSIDNSGAFPPFDGDPRMPDLGQQDFVPQQKQDKSKTLLIVVLALVVVLLAGGIAGVMIFRHATTSNKSTTKEASTTAANAGESASAADSATKPAESKTTKSITAATSAITTKAVTTATTTAGSTTQPGIIVSVPTTYATTTQTQTQPPQQVGYEQAQVNFCSFYASYINAMNAQTRSGIVLCSSEVAESMYSRMSLNSRSRFTLNYIDFDLDTFKALSGSRVQYIVRCHSTVYDRSSGAYKDVIDARWNVVSTYDAAAGVFNVTSMTRNDSIVFGSRYDRYTP